jgi:hypothetical protein
MLERQHDRCSRNKRRLAVVARIEDKHFEETAGF